MSRKEVSRLDAASARKKIAAAKSNKRFVSTLLDRDHRGHRDAVEQWTRLHQAAFPEPSTTTAVHRPDRSQSPSADSGMNSTIERRANNLRTPIARARFPDRPIKDRRRDAENGDHPTTPSTAQDAEGGSGPPILNNEDERIRAIIENASARFEIAENPDADPEYGAWRSSNALGLITVRRHRSIVEREARAQGVDPDLVKAIMYVENAQSLDSQVDEGLGLGLSESLLPMNIRPDPWAAIEDPPVDLSDPATNIRIAVTLIRRIIDRIDDPTPAKVASIWNFTGRELVNDFGARVQDVYDRKPWNPDHDALNLSP